MTAALFTAGTPASVSAEEVAFKPKAAGDINVRLRGIGVVPTERGDIKTAGGTDTGLNTRLGNSYVPEVDVSYFITPNIAPDCASFSAGREKGSCGFIITMNWSAT